MAMWHDMDMWQCLIERGSDMMGKMMRRMAFAGIALSTLMMAPSAMSATFVRDCETPKHNFQILRIDNTKLVYRSWNKPKKAGIGQPDLQLINGTSDWEQAGECGPHEWYTFSKGNLVLKVDFGSCSAKRHNADAEMTILIDQVVKGHYWVKEKSSQMR